MPPKPEMTDEVLNEEQYSPESVANYELVYGADFISPGGKDRAREFLSLLNLEPGSKVLDVGCGVGGGPFLLAQEFGATVRGIDMSESMIASAQKRCRKRGLSERVVFEAMDCLQLKEKDEYDAVVSRDVFLHVHDKALLFKRLFQALKPGGRLLFSDYCCGPPPWPPAFTKYVEGRRYCLHQIDEYARLLQKAGFEQVKAEDITDLFVETLEVEARSLGKVKMKLTTKATLLMAWKAKIAAAHLGVHRWGLFQAVKPTSSL